jgi:hypothetical protein
MFKIPKQDFTAEFKELAVKREGAARASARWPGNWVWLVCGRPRAVRRARASRRAAAGGSLPSAAPARGWTPRPASPR